MATHTARRWRFATAEFDEGSWTLTVDGRPVAIEAKPLELLRELLLRPGQVLTKDDLLDAVWPGVSVVEASLPTAIGKLRRALGDDDNERRIIDTVPRKGYRLAIPVALAGASSDAEPLATEPSTVPVRRNRWLAASVLAAVLVAGVVIGAIASRHLIRPRIQLQAEAAYALRTLDLPKVQALLKDGWNPNTAFDEQGNGALNVLLQICEWDTGHDRRKLLLVARTLLDAGARVDTHNAWGDTAYSIAKAKRYCGPDHPVTKMLWTSCYAGFRPLGERCESIPSSLASG